MTTQEAQLRAKRRKQREKKAKELERMIRELDEGAKREGIPRWAYIMKRGLDGCL